MKDSSNASDSGKMSGYSVSDPKIKVMAEVYTAADADEYIKEVVEDYGTVEKRKDGNPSGVVLTKWNGERATRRYIQSALQLNTEEKVDKWMETKFDKAWGQYDVNKENKIEAGLLPLYFKSLLEDNTAEITLNENDRFRTALRNTY